MRSVNLCFTIDCVAEDETPAAPVIHHHLNLHLTRHGFEFISNSSNARSCSESSPDLPWTYLTTLRGRRSSAYAARLQSCNSDPNLVTHAALYSNASRLCQPGAPYSGYKLVYIGTSAVVTRELEADLTSPNICSDRRSTPWRWHPPLLPGATRLEWPSYCQRSRRTRIH